jgi:DNA-binding response OmpR family regulator
MRVLLVEDDPMIGEAIQGALKDASYAADWVKDGQTALTTLGCQHYDLVLLDWVCQARMGWRCWPASAPRTTRFLCSSSRRAG